MKFILLFLIVINLSLFGEESHDSLNFLLQKAENNFQKNELLIQAAENEYKKYNFNKSLSYYSKALKNSDDIDQISKILGRIGRIHSLKSNYKQATEFYNKAIKHNIKIDNQKALATNYLELGEVFVSLSNLDDAIINYDKSIEIFSSLSNKVDLSYAYLHKGDIFYKKNDYQNAEIFYQKAKSLIDDSIDLKNLSLIELKLGEVKLRENDFKAAISYFERSLQYNLELESIWGISAAKGDLGLAYTGLFNGSNQEVLDTAILYLKNAIKGFDSINSIHNVSYYTSELSEAYLKKSDFKNAYFALNRHKEISDSILSFETSRQIADLNNKQEMEILKEKESAQKEEKEIITISALSGIGLIGFFTFLIYRRLKKEKRLGNILENTHNQLLEKNGEILASIRYAQTIQNAMLPWKSDLEKHLNYFLIYKPKDIVSGDFYWFKPLENGYLIAVVDCTGHGVPGSMISMMGSSILDEAVQTQGLRNTGEILTYLNRKMIEALNKQVTENNSRDGMDVCLLRVINYEGEKNLDTEIQFSGAKRPLYINQYGNLITIKGDRNSIAGKKHLDDDFVFSSQDKIIKQGSKLFLSSDGFVDQIGSNGKKFGTKQLKSILSKNLSLHEYHQYLETEFINHISKEPQRDDITILGIEI